MKVLHIAEYTKGGVATILNSLVEYQENQSCYSVSLLIEENHSKFVSCGNKIVFRGGRNLFGLVRFGFAIFSVIRKEKPDIVHLHSSFAGLLGRLVLGMFKVKIIYQPHGVAFDPNRVSGIKCKIYKLVERLLSFPTDKIIAISRYEVEQLRTIVKEDKIVQVNNGVNDIQFIADSKRNGRLLFVGRLDVQKGLDILLDVYQKGLISKGLDIVGESVLGEYKYNSSLKNVNFLGWKTQTELEKLYSECDAVIMPSRWEGFGLVAIEAFRGGTPVICSNRGALPSLIENEKNGFVFNLENYTQSIPECISKFETSCFDKLSDTSRKTYLESYTSLRMCKELNQVYEIFK